jgi:TM2 domain-containing membrane protein YozV
VRDEPERDEPDSGEPEREEPETDAAPAYPPRGVPWKAALLAWLMPGLGHLYTGRWLRGLVFAAIVLALVFGGCSLDGKLWRPAGSPLDGGSGTVSAFLTAISVGMGLPYAALAVSGYRGLVTAQGYEYGTTFLLTAALMNLLLVFDARDLSLGRKP